ncbi:hypothetical protein NG800_008830 [Epilithonimonas ginsengisoli]|uniref:DUF4238 domain-containing protein n=1 Tax=Epilithonimonas ginsengisoli TaxID=1245592 RepID=A0ABU4JH87_9FLAO|nr:MULTISPECIES: hypothetical protein [Chryseobacterium group]MBV6880351.1 hypothetical protein [Epilithonimonas sp. FP105]MDW8549015.1 hypothetical protein [Epilithonimonas ginsengisoli]OAH74756.1 hypothetical protein AXA65_05885 [Chryseobacterium sp. FP211-J200]
MRFAYPMQKFQDWVTQQWVILRGRKIKPEDFPWLIGPFGNLDAIGEDFIHQFARKEDLIIEKDSKAKGIIPSMAKLNLSETEFSDLSKNVIDFYESTEKYDLKFAVKWNPFFKFFGILITKLFSNRINQLNIPTKNIADSESLKSEIINLVDQKSNEIKYTFWFRSIESSGQVIYSGVYGICTLPSGKTCVKAVFPLPNGNATVIMNPSVGENGRLILDSSGEKFGDAGFYFLLQDSKGEYWSQFISSFRDRLAIGPDNDHISAEQNLTLWHLKVLTFNYKIELKK